MANRDPLNHAICIFVIISCAAIVSESEKCDKQDDLYVIRNVGPNGLVLDALDPEQIRMQHFTGSETQLWRLKPVGRPGLYRIVNQHHGKVLDFILGDDDYFLAVLSELNNSVQQMWSFSPQGLIVNAANDKNVDIELGQFTPGTRVLVWAHNGNPWQTFLLQKKI